MLIVLRFTIFGQIQHVSELPICYILNNINLFDFPVIQCPKTQNYQTFDLKKGQMTCNMPMVRPIRQRPALVAKFSRKACDKIVCNEFNKESKRFVYHLNLTYIYTHPICSLSNHYFIANFQVYNLPKDQKMAKLAMYSACQYPECRCIGWKTPEENRHRDVENNYCPRLIEECRNPECKHALGKYRQ